MVQSSENAVTLEMYLDGELIEVAYFSLAWSAVQLNKQLQWTRECLLKKHKKLLAQSKKEPLFVLNGVPSLMNDFSPLAHKKN